MAKSTIEVIVSYKENKALARSQGVPFSPYPLDSRHAFEYRTVTDILRWCYDALLYIEGARRVDFTLYGREGRKCCFAVDAHDFQSTYAFRQCRKNILGTLEE